MKKNPVILNLCTDLPYQLEEYFKMMEGVVLTETDLNNEVDAIIVDKNNIDLSNFKNAKVLSLVKPEELSSFIEQKGRIYFNPEFLKHDFYPIVLKKFFDQEINIHLNESFSGILKFYKNF